MRWKSTTTCSRPIKSASCISLIRAWPSLWCRILLAPASPMCVFFLPHDYVCICWQNVQKKSWVHLCRCCLFLSSFILKITIFHMHTGAPWNFVCANCNGPWLAVCGWRVLHSGGGRAQARGLRHDPQRRHHGHGIRGHAPAPWILVSRRWY